jgi:hypothetical protein
VALYDQVSKLDRILPLVPKIIYLDSVDDLSKVSLSDAMDKQPSVWHCMTKSLSLGKFCLLVPKIYG